jgi:allantoate deiminase
MTLIERADEIVRWCRDLSACSEAPGVTTRTFLSAPMHDVHERLSTWMTSLGMSVRVDAAGNLRGLYAAAPSADTSAAQDQDSSSRLLIGSHLDTVPDAGAFDGVLGVVVGVALVQALDGRRLPFAIEVVGFSDEEGTRFGVPFIGSRALVGGLDDDLLDRRDAAGARVRDAIGAFGLDERRIADARMAASVFGYLEVHIEQGPVLERLDVPVGVVDAIAGQSRQQLTFDGAAAHAGTTPMLGRRDALAAAAEWIVAVERYAAAVGGLVATVGSLAAHPGAGNVIPGRAIASLDVRHKSDDVRHRATDELLQEAREIAARRNVAVAVENRLDQAAVVMNQPLTTRLARAVEASGHRVHHMTSGAGHDAMVLASRAPAAMLFVRSPGGISHHPDETVRSTDVAAVLSVVLRFVEDLARD